ncbi:MAG: DMT family transporter [Pseudohongiellaceae bacterium]|nr:MAG: hypothetical protein A3H44_11640 [Gammaproteobacteria bacterium RIFCSPLOWO2_02_FULL_57_10]
MSAPDKVWNNPWLQIHFCVFLWGFTAILGRLISLPALPLVLWRMLMVAVVLFLLPRVWRGLARLSGRHLLAFSGVGVLVALHWLTFYGSIKLANASVAATCMALVPVFLCVIEPLVTGSRFRRAELVLGLLVLPGIALVVGGTPESMNTGILVGVLSAFLVALFSAYNKRLVTRTDALSVTALEMLAGGVFLALVSALLSVLPLSAEAGAFFPVPSALFALPPAEDVGYLLLLAFGCTLLPFALSLHALRRLSAYASALAVNLEPIYAIMLAIVILGEQRELGVGFYAGALIIVAVVFIHALQRQR